MAAGVCGFEIGAHVDGLLFSFGRGFVLKLEVLCTHSQDKVG